MEYVPVIFSSDIFYLDFYNKIDIILEFILASGHYEVLKLK